MGWRITYLTSGKKGKSEGVGGEGQEEFGAWSILQEHTAFGRAWVVRLGHPVQTDFHTVNSRVRTQRSGWRLEVFPFVVAPLFFIHYIKYKTKPCEYYVCCSAYYRRTGTYWFWIRIITNFTCTSVHVWNLNSARSSIYCKLHVVVLSCCIILIVDL